MSSFGFRFRFLLPEDFRIQCDEKTLSILLPDLAKPLVLKSVSGSKINESGNLAFFGSGFHTIDEAYHCGVKLKKSLLICGASLHMGIDVGDDKSTNCFFKPIIDAAKAEGYTLLNDVHGVIAYEEDIPIIFGSLNATILIGNPSNRFTEVLTKAYIENPELTLKQTLALELYGMSHFESSLRARFLTLVSAIESLVQRNLRPKEVQDFLVEIRNLTQTSKLSDPEKQSLLKALNELSFNSTTRLCKQLLKRYQKSLRRDAIDFLRECYDIRSRILHDGQQPQGVDLGTKVPELDKFVSQLLIANILKPI